MELSYPSTYRDAALQSTVHFNLGALRIATMKVNDVIRLVESDG